MPLPPLFILAGDTTGTLAGLGGSQSLTAKRAQVVKLFGDAAGDGIAATGGNDTLVGAADPGGAVLNYLHGDVGGSLSGGSLGGMDSIIGGKTTHNEIAGDAGGDLLDTSHGGNDTLVGGAGGSNIIFGDAGLLGGIGGMMRGLSVGGNDSILGGAGATTSGYNTFYGDAFHLTDSAAGGSDTIRGGKDSGNTLFGDADSMDDAAHGGDDSMLGGVISAGGASHGWENRLVGDAAIMHGTSLGGNDTLRGGGGAGASNVLRGDANEMYDTAHGGKDSLVGGAGIDNEISGDAGLLEDHTRGGNDTLLGGAGAVNGLYGDAYVELAGSAIGGNDRITGGAHAVNLLVGDASGLVGAARGGNDRLTGGAGGQNDLYGDAPALGGNARGGNDTLTGADNLSADITGFAHNILYGDANTLDGSTGTIICGNDVLVSGVNSNDLMYGDSVPIWRSGSVALGHDRFGFGPGNGQDTIGDFQQGLDVIDLRGFAGAGIHGLAGLLIDASNPEAPLVGLGGTDTILVIFDGTQAHGALGAGDFLFA